ncbi:hypothetical protein ACTFIZ_007852 [Dictyostelium cf. discoideum]
MGNKNSAELCDGANDELIVDIKEFSKDEEFINVVKNFIKLCEKIMKKENKNFLENQNELIKLISNTIKQSKYYGEISSDISKNLINIRENYLLVALDQINSSTRKVITTCQLKIDIASVVKLVDVGKDQIVDVKNLVKIESDLIKFTETINSQKDNLFYKKLFKLLRVNQKIQDKKKPINLAITGVSCVSTGVLSTTIVVSIGLSAIPITIPVSVLIIGCASTLMYLMNKSINNGRIYDDFINTISLISTQLTNFICHLSICSNDICENLRKSLDLLEKSENKVVSVENVEASVKIVDRILEKIQLIQTLSKKLKSLEECLNEEGTR